MEKSNLTNYLAQGMSYRKIAIKENCSAKKVEYWVNKYNLKKLSAYNKLYLDDVDAMFFNKIDTKNKAYIAGFILGDGYISSKNDVELSIMLSDIKLLNDIAKEIPWELKISVDTTIDKTTGRFPRTRMKFRSRHLGKHLVKHFGGVKSTERKTPRISKHLEPYLVAGFFDADGCITYGYRKDRNRLWHKANFTASDLILVGIQNILIKYDVSSTIRPKVKEKVHVLEFANKKSICNFYAMMPTDCIRLKRKVDKFNKLNKILETK